LLEAWKRLQLIDAELVIAGGIDAEIDRQFRREVPANVRWLHHVPSAAVHRLYQSSDVFVLPSLSEGSALVIYEAMASGLPVIVTPNSGSVARDGVDGYVVPSRNVSAIAERLEWLHGHPDLRIQMGAAARHLILEKYTWQHYRRRLAAAYAALAAGQPVQDAVDGI
jgi:glycosyltransferase involved in cell wall biosynthesis